MPRAPDPDEFPIVGIGASAGGLAAFEAFFSGMPTDRAPGMAFVLVQHLAPDHQSILTELVRRFTTLEVFEIEDGMKVRVDCAYIIPPNRDLALLDGALHLLEPSAPRGQRLPVDYFFRSLARELRDRAICIVLSGTGSDGALGVRAVKAEGGLVLAQQPETTEFGGMPKSAIDTGLVDYVSAPAEMPSQLLRYVAHAFARGPAADGAPTSGIVGVLGRICVLLRHETGHDFSQYKENTVVRRIERRMMVHQIERPEDYVRFLQDNPSEGQALFRDLLIGVTHFFRDPDAFAALATQALAPLVAAKPSGASVRVWVCGCATGEEAFSVAMLLQEEIARVERDVRVQVFATDIDGRSVAAARAALYPASVAEDVGPERLARWFVADADTGGYRIRKSIRELVVFSEQDVIKDPPFSRLDLITCRNLLIYLNPELQRKLITVFHYGLNPGGVLFLGSSEAVADQGSMFAPLDRRFKLYRRQEGAGAMPPVTGFMPPFVKDAGRTREGPRATSQESLRDLTMRTLLMGDDRAAVLVTGRGEILHIFGRTGKFLEPAAGEADLNVLSMAREGLRPPLMSALHGAASRGAPVAIAGLQVRTNGGFSRVDLEVRPAVSTAGARPGLLVVVLQEVLAPHVGPANPGLGRSDDEEGAQIGALQRELRAKDEYLQSTLEEMETANEELKSTNEELQSVNEELQSTNEELETSKEELQSVNEELATVNAELQTKVTDLSCSNNDMNNLLAGTGIATLFVDHQLRIVRFTPTATELVNLISADIGRPVAHIASNLAGYDRLVADVEGVLRDLVPREVEVQTNQGAWFLMRIRPYRTLENVIEGAVITFVDITQSKRVGLQLEERERESNALRRASAHGVALFDGTPDPRAFRCVFANAVFERVTGGSAQSALPAELVDALAAGEGTLPYRSATGSGHLCTVIRLRPARLCMILEALPDPPQE